MKEPNSSSKFKLLRPYMPKAIRNIKSSTNRFNSSFVSGTGVEKYQVKTQKLISNTEMTIGQSK